MKTTAPIAAWPWVIRTSTNVTSNAAQIAEASGFYATAPAMIRRMQSGMASGLMASLRKLALQHAQVLNDVYRQSRKHFLIMEEIQMIERPLTYDAAVTAFKQILQGTRVMPDQPNRELSELRGTMWYLRNIHGPMARVNHKGEVHTGRLEQ